MTASVYAIYVLLCASLGIRSGPCGSYKICIYNPSRLIFNPFLAILLVPQVDLVWRRLVPRR